MVFVKTTYGQIRESLDLEIEVKYGTQQKWSRFENFYVVSMVKFVADNT